MNWNKTKRKNHDAGTESRRRRRRRIKISTHTTNDQNQSGYLIQFVLFCAQNENKTKNSINIQDSIIIINSSWKQKFLFFTNNFFLNSLLLLLWFNFKPYPLPQHNFFPEKNDDIAISFSSYNFFQQKKSDNRHEWITQISRTT